MIEKPFYRVQDLVDMGLGRTTTIYKMIATGKLKAVKSGKATLIINLREYLDSLPAAEITLPGTMAKIAEQRAKRVRLDDTISK